jgi:hypothetical protein
MPYVDNKVNPGPSFQVAVQDAVHLSFHESRGVCHEVNEQKLPRL